jgi:hypothetical protein
MAQISARNPDDRLAMYLRGLEDRIAAVERKQPLSISIRDPSRQRMLLGYDSSNGKYGIKIWDAAGTLQSTTQF